MSTVTKETFWTQIVEDPTLYGTITTDDNLFNYRSDAVWQVMNETFIANGTNFEVTKWEELLGLSVAETTLNGRKAAILNHITENLPITIGILEQLLKEITNDDYLFEYDNKTQNLFVSFNDEYNNEVDNLISRLVPQPLVIENGHGLPKGFYLIDFLEGTGNQYIDTLTKVPFSWSFELDAQYTDVSKQFSGLFGTRTQDWSKALGSWVRDSHFYLLYGSSESPIYVKAEALRRQIFEYSGRENYFRAGNTTRQLSKLEDFESTFNFGLFGITYSGGNASYSRIWYTKIWSNDGKLQRHFLPCLDTNGSPCMYDLVSKTVFYKRGTGDFTAGLNLSQTLNLANKLPTVDGKLTLSLPWDARLMISGTKEALQEVTNKGWTLTVQYREGDSNSDLYTKYLSCTNVADLTAVNEDYKNDLSYENEWIYPLQNLTDGVSLFQKASNLKRVNMTFPSITSARGMFNSCSALEELDIFLPQVTNVQQWLGGCSNLKNMKADLPVCTNAHSLCTGVVCDEVFINIPNITYLSYAFSFSKVKIIKSDHTSLTNFVNGNDPINDSSYRTLEEWPWELPNLKNGKGFGGIVLNKTSTLRILNSIPTWSDGAEHSLTIGIHVDNQSDEEIIAAISDTESRGWTVTVQWNGTPSTSSASNYALLDRRPIYAKTYEIIGIDGNLKTILDWGHYTTEWEKNGYIEFSSIEEANEYFNITNEE